MLALSLSTLLKTECAMLILSYFTCKVQECQDHYHSEPAAKSSVPQINLTLTSVKNSGVPKTTFRFDNSLELFTEFTVKTVTFPVMVYYSARIQITVSQEKWHKGQSLSEFHTWSL